MALPRDHLEAVNRAEKHRFGQVLELLTALEVPLTCRLLEFQESGGSKQDVGLA